MAYDYDVCFAFVGHEWRHCKMLQLQNTVFKSSHWLCANIQVQRATRSVFCQVEV